MVVYSQQLSATYSTIVIFLKPTQQCAALRSCIFTGILCDFNYLYVEKMANFTNVQLKNSLAGRVSAGKKTFAINHLNGRRYRWILPAPDEHVASRLYPATNRTTKKAPAMPEPFIVLCR